MYGIFLTQQTFSDFFYIFGHFFYKITYLCSMKKIRITRPEGKVGGHIVIPASKSISNRALLLQALCDSPDKGTLLNLAECDDTRALSDALRKDVFNSPCTIDINGAGTAMRFLTAYYSCLPNCDVLLTGNERMKQRPIGPLTEALQNLGADITFTDSSGFPPLHIRGKALQASETTIDGSISSQFVSALLMMAPVMGSEGFRLHLQGHIASRPYIDMTLMLMRQFGITADWESSDTIVVQPGNYQPCNLTIEGDWSAASYWIGLQTIALFRHLDCEIHLEGLVHDSIQGDSVCSTLLNPWSMMHGEMTPDCAGTPDLIPTLAVVYCLAGRPFRIFGAESLLIKESNRINALVNELATLGYPIEVKESEWRGHKEVTLIWNGERREVLLDASYGAPVIHTYGDHRMAMAFAPAALVFGNIIIEDPEVVSKSYPTFWEDFARIGFTITAIE